MKKKLVKTVGDLTILHVLFSYTILGHIDVSSRSTDKFGNLLMFKTMHMNECFVN